MNLNKLRGAAEDIVWSAIKSVDPEKLIHQAVRLDGGNLDIGGHTVKLADFGRIIVVGTGKASGAMAKALEEILGDRISDGVIVVKDGYAAKLSTIQLVEAGHPVPDERGVEGARAVLSLVHDEASAETLVLCLVSGGGSALMPLPRDGISLEDKQETTRLLLRCGASIDEINAVRKHISEIKGGQLGRAAAPSRLFSLILSDVVGDKLDVIASGPTVGDSSTYSTASDILHNYQIWTDLPQSVRDVFEQGLKGEIDETPDPTSPIFESITNILIGTNRTAVQAAAGKADSLGFNPLILSTCMTGEAKEVGTVLASIAREAGSTGNPLAPPVCILAGGETTVTIHGDGKGGRNQELALSAAIKLADTVNVVIASVGTDGTDGPTDAAGAIIDTTTVQRARQQGLDPVAYLRNNDSYNLLQSIGDLLVTGPTNTNVMDLAIILVA